MMKLLFLSVLFFSQLTFAQDYSSCKTYTAVQARPYEACLMAYKYARNSAKKACLTNNSSSIECLESDSKTVRNPKWFNQCKSCVTFTAQ